MMLTADDQFLAGRGDVNTDMILIALMVPVVLGFHRNPATHNMRVEPIQFAYFFTNFGCYRIRMRYSTKGNLQWYLHD
jgi:hypothetical protein